MRTSFRNLLGAWVGALLLCGCAPMNGGNMPDGEACMSEPDCELGENCTDGACVATTEPDIQYWAVVDLMFGPVADGGTIEVEQGPQGGIHTFVSILATGFEPNELLLYSAEVRLAETNEIIGQPPSQQFLSSEIAEGINEIQGIFLRLTGANPGEVDGREGIVTLELSSVNDPTRTASVTQRVVLQEVPQP